MISKHMKLNNQNEKTENGWSSLKLALTIGLCTLLVGNAMTAFGDCTFDTVTGKKCVAKSDTTGGSCTGNCTAQPPTCGGTKSQTTYNGCTSCTTGNLGENPDTCTMINGGGTCNNCQKKTRSQNCSCYAGDNGGPLVCDVPPGSWPSYGGDWQPCSGEKLCQ